MQNSILFRVLPIVVLLLALSSCEKEHLVPQEDLRSNELISISSHAKMRPALAKPIITCSSVTQTSIYISVCAGATGAPAGFSIQWVPKSVLMDNGGIWDGLSDPLNPYNSYYCAASFSGNAHLSRYNLAAGECVTVNIGDMLFDNGASSNCIRELVCGTDYVFRAFAHGNNSVNRSEFTALDLTNSLECSTLDCSNNPGCTEGQGYWKTHGPTGCVTGNNTNQWPVSSLTLGTVDYSDLQLCAILQKPAQGNGLISLAHQLIAAKLNIENGSDPTDAAIAIAAADNLIGALVVPPVGTGSLAPSATSGLTTTLTNYNEGAIGPGNCSDD